jgi:hypothetical protein
MSVIPTSSWRTVFRTLVALGALGAVVGQSPLARAQAITEEAAHTIGVDA